MGKMIKFSAVAGLSLMALIACGSNEVMEEAVVEEKTLVESVECTDPRPQMCTMDYTPVCGVTAAGEKKTYGNACGACGDAEVLSHVPGECDI